VLALGQIGVLDRARARHGSAVVEAAAEAHAGLGVAEGEAGGRGRARRLRRLVDRRGGRCGGVDRPGDRPRGARVTRRVTGLDGERVLTVGERARVALRARARLGRRAVEHAPERRLGISIGEAEFRVAPVAHRVGTARHRERRRRRRVDGPAVDGRGAEPARAAPGRHAETVVALGQLRVGHRAGAAAGRPVVEPAIEAHAPPRVREGEARIRRGGGVGGLRADPRRGQRRAAVVALVTLVLDASEHPRAAIHAGQPDRAAGGMAGREGRYSSRGADARAAAGSDEAVLDPRTRRAPRAQVAHGVRHAHTCAVPRRRHARHREVGTRRGRKSEREQRHRPKHGPSRAGSGPEPRAARAGGCRSPPRPHAPARSAPRPSRC